MPSEALDHLLLHLVANCYHKNYNFLGSRRYFGNKVRRALQKAFQVDEAVFMKKKERNCEGHFNVISFILGVIHHRINQHNDLNQEAPMSVSLLKSLESSVVD